MCALPGSRWLGPRCTGSPVRHVAGECTQLATSAHIWCQDAAALMTPEEKFKRMGGQSDNAIIFLSNFVCLAVTYSDFEYVVVMTPDQLVGIAKKSRE